MRAIDTGGGRFEQVVKSKLEIMVADDQAEVVMQTIQTHAHTGKVGDGRVFVIPIEATLGIRTGQPEWVPPSAEAVAASQMEVP